MDIEFEQSILHNPALGAVLLWQFTAEYFKAKQQNEGPQLPKLLLVLPMTFHLRTTAAIHGMKRSSGLLKALADEPLIRVGLQQRLIDFAECSNSSMLLACAAKLMRIEKHESWPQFVPVKTSASIPKDLAARSDDLDTMMKATRRLGPWFADFGTEALFAALGVRF